MSLFSIGLSLFIPVAVYFLFIRHKAALLEVYTLAGGGWAGIKAVLAAFQTWLIGTAGLVLPEIIAAVSWLATQDITWLTPEWQNYIRMAGIGLMMLGRAWRTTPAKDPPSGEA